MISHKIIHNGFTLIELVIVIVILAILAVTAAPKFIDLNSDAKAATLEAIGGAMESGLLLINAKAIVENQTGDSGTIQINDTDIPLYNGYPSVNGGDSFVETNAQVKAWLEIDAVDRNTAFFNRDSAMFFTDKYSSLNIITIFFTEDYALRGFDFACQVRYQNPVSTNPDKPTITVETSDCQ